MSDPAYRARGRGFDALIVLAAVGAALEVTLRDDPNRAPELELWLALPLSAALVLALLPRRRFPLGAPATLWLAAAALSFVDARIVVFPFTIFAAGLAAAFLLGSLRDERRGRIGLAVVVGAAATTMLNHPDPSGGEVVFVPAVFALAWVAGFALRERGAQARAAEARATQAEEEAAVAARIAVAEERTRIARELHDIVAHAVSVMVLHVGAVRHNLPEAQADDRAALEDVERTGRRALGEMRRLLGAMREATDGVDLEPQPGLASLGALVERMRAAGLPVSLTVEGNPDPLPRGVDLSAYRIVQEGLTNVVKHAGASRADVVVRRTGEILELVVTDDGRGPANGRAGYGLTGVGERVKLYDGNLDAGAAPSGSGFRLAATLRVPEVG